jgi:hypothetical protein
MSINKFTILGERCSGTNYLEELIKLNFNINFTNEFGSKHFFCFRDYSKFNCDDTLFIGIIRNPIYWLNSFSKELYHVPEVNRKNIQSFLLNEFYSVCDEINPIQLKNSFMMNNRRYVTKYEVNKLDLNYKTGKKYTNIFELRNNKNHFLMNIMPNKVKNYILINYEDLLFNLEKTLLIIKSSFKLSTKFESIKNTKKYKKSDSYKFIKQREITLHRDILTLIWNNLNINQESQLGYFKGNNNLFFMKTKQYIPEFFIITSPFQRNLELENSKIEITNETINSQLDKHIKNVEKKEEEKVEVIYPAYKSSDVDFKSELVEIKSEIKKLIDLQNKSQLMKKNNDNINNNQNNQNNQNNHNNQNK